MLCAIGTGAAPARAAWFVAGPDYWRESGAVLVVRGMPWRVGPWRARVRMFRDVAREPAVEPTGGRGERNRRPSSRAIEPVLCGLCGLRGGPDLDSWAAKHPLSLAGTRTRNL